MMLMLAACGSQQETTSTEAPADTATSTEATTDSSSSAATESTANTQQSTDAAATSTPEAAAPADSNAAASQDSYIGEDAAKAAALADAGIAEADCTEMKCELDTDDGTVHYDVDFKAGGLEYEYDIDAVTGEVMSSSSEVDD